MAKKRILSAEEHEKLNGNLLSAAWHGEATEIVKFLKSGANITAKDDDGETALHLAAENGCIEACKVLIKHGANVNAMNNKYETPAYKAEKKKHVDIHELIEKKGGHNGSNCLRKNMTLSSLKDQFN
jgi:ankyrin repeat protein